MGKATGSRPSRGWRSGCAASSAYLEDLLQDADEDEDEEPQDTRTWRLYELLKVHRGVSVRVLTRAYRARARALHPDKGGSTREFQELGRAYAVLADTERRAQYDAVGDAGLGAAVAESELPAKVQRWLEEAARLPELDAPTAVVERVLCAAARLRPHVARREKRLELKALARTKALSPLARAEVCEEPPALVFSGPGDGLLIAYVPEDRAPLADLAAAAEVGASGDVVVVLVVRRLGRVVRPTAEQLAEAELVLQHCLASAA